MEPAALFLANVERALQPSRLGDTGLVVAVSGGPDSVALLRAVIELRLRSGHSAPLTAGHLNHKIRGAESDADEWFVQQLCRELNERHAIDLRFCSWQINVVASAAQARANLESTSRRLRYDWLAELARSYGVRTVATGHTADDQAETVFYNLLRGSGLRGLRGIARHRPIGEGVVLIRPLLEIGRGDVLAYLDSLGQSYRNDSSNSDLRYARNRIRHQVLPFLAGNGYAGIGKALVRLSSQARASYEDKREMALTLISYIELPRAGPLVILDNAKLSLLSRTWIREVIREIWLREGWPRAEMGYREWDRLAGLACGEPPSLDLPGGIKARRRQHVVQLGPDCY